MAPWKTLSSQTVFEHPMLGLEVMERSNPQGVMGSFMVLHSPAWVNVVPITPDGEVVLIKQWRQGIAGPSLEIPGGLVDPGEQPSQAGARELKEETGYEASEMSPLGWVHTNPALFDNQCYTYLAADARKTGPQELEELEDIEVILVPESKLPGMVQSGEITHSLVLAALNFYWLKKGSMP